MADINAKKKITEFPRITFIAATEDKGVRLEWTKVNLAERYFIKRSTNPEEDFEPVDWASGLSFTDTTVPPDTVYWYKVVAWKRLDGSKKGSITESAIQPAVVSDIPAVTNLKAEAKKGKLCLTWDRNDGDEFIVYKRSDHFTKIMCLGRTKDNSFFDNLPVSGQVNHYKVQKVKLTDEGELHGIISEEADYVFIDKAEIRSLKKIIGKKAIINVKVIAGADGYILERCEKKNGEFTEVSRTKDITEVNFEDKLPGRGSYSYRVCAYKNVGDKEHKGSYSEIKHL